MIRAGGDPGGLSLPKVSRDPAASNELISGSSGCNCFGPGFQLAWFDGDFHRIFHCSRICGVEIKNCKTELLRCLKIYIIVILSQRI